MDKDDFKIDLTDEQVKSLEKDDRVNAIINRVYYAVLNQVRSEIEFDEDIRLAEMKKLTERISFLDRQNIGMALAVVLLAVKVFFF